MATFRTVKNRNNPYVMLNKIFIEDPRISYKAKGILARLLSKPDDWVIYETELTRAAADGRDSIRSGIKELIDAGYIRRNRQRDAKGRLRQMEYDVYELPVIAEASEESGDVTTVEDLILDAFRQAGATGEVTEEIRQEARDAIRKGKKIIDARGRWG